MDPFAELRQINSDHHNPRPIPVVRPSLPSTSDLDFNEGLIDRILGTPEKIPIPERYIPEQEPDLGPEEEEKRTLKAERICRLLSRSGGVGALPLVLPPKPFPSTKQQQFNVGRIVGGVQVLPQHPLSVPSSPARRGKLVSVKKGSTPNLGVKKRPNSSSLCDWSLAGVIPPSFPPG